MDMILITEKHNVSETNLLMDFQELTSDMVHTLINKVIFYGGDRIEIEYDFSDEMTAFVELAESRKGEIACMQQEMLADKEYDFAGKTIWSLCTHEGSRLGSSERDIARSVPDAELAEGLAVKGSAAQIPRGAVKKNNA